MIGRLRVALSVALLLLGCGAVRGDSFLELAVGRVAPSLVAGEAPEESAIESLRRSAELAARPAEATLDDRLPSFPEPVALVLWGLGLLGIAGVIRRRRTALPIPADTKSRQAASTGPRAIGLPVRS